METKRIGINGIFADIYQVLENTVEPISLALMNTLFNVVAEVLFNKKIEELKKLLDNLKKLEAILTCKSFSMVREKDLGKVRAYKQFVFEFIKKANEEVSEEEELVLQKISKTGWSGISSYDLFCSLRDTKLNNASELDGVSEKLIKKQLLCRKEDYLFITEKGRKCLKGKIEVIT